MSEVVEELPILALILHSDSTPMHIGSRLVWLILAGMIMRPRATSARIGLGVQALAARHVFHLFGDPPLAGIMHLCADLVAGAGRHPCLSHTALIICDPAAECPVKQMYTPEIFMDQSTYSMNPPDQKF